MKIILCDTDPGVLAAWRLQFAQTPQAEVREGSIFDSGADALLGPGNSFGFMDGGLALRISERFGFQLEEAVRGTIESRYDGEMLVGQAAVLPTGGTPAYLVYAPTMRTPQVVKDSLNAYLAAGAALRAVAAFHRQLGEERIQTLALPGLCTRTGKMHPFMSARQVRYALEEFLGLRGRGKLNLSKLSRREKKLRSLPQSATAPEGAVSSGADNSQHPGDAQLPGED